MKKALIIIFLLNISLVWTANAQEPTKQETLDWIAGKFEKYLIKETKGRPYKDYFIYFKYSFNKYYEGILYLNRSQMNTKSDNSIFDEVVKIDLNKISKVEIIKTELGERLILIGNAIFYYDETWRSSFYLSSNDDNIEYAQKLMNFDNEPNLFERMKKAFQNLSKLNNTEGFKEKF